MTSAHAATALDRTAFDGSLDYRLGRRPSLVSATPSYRHHNSRYVHNSTDEAASMKMSAEQYGNCGDDNSDSSASL